MMIWLAAALAQDCPEPATAIENLRVEPSPENYHCAAALGVEVLVEAAPEPMPNGDRITRALAVYRLDHLDEAIEPPEARAYLPADVRLVSDGIYAHRGRKSPAEAHVMVFERFDWYAPDPTYTDGRLTEVDRANLEMLTNPPPPSEEPTAADAMASAEDAPPRRESACACSTGAVGPWALALLILARRGRAPSGGRGRDASPPRA